MITSSSVINNHAYKKYDSQIKINIFKMKKYLTEKISIQINEKLEFKISFNFTGRISYNEIRQYLICISLKQINSVLIQPKLLFSNACKVDLKYIYYKLGVFASCLCSLRFQ